MDLPSLTADQMREVDRVMVEDLRIELPQMMENAGRSLVDLARRRFRPDRVVVLAGPGGNGGGGLVAARLLANRGADVTIVLSHPAGSMGPVLPHQLDIAGRMGLAVQTDPPEADLVVDAILGYSLRGDPAGRAAELVEWANGQRAVLSLDIPSGLDATTGRVADPCVRATATLTLALPKVGLLRAPGEVVGELYLADISVPPLVYARLGLAAGPVFADDAIIPVPRPRGPSRRPGRAGPVAT